MRPYPACPLYGVTEDGRVFRLAKPRNGRVCPYELIQNAGKRGYPTVAIEGRTTPVHRLVAETFIPNPDCKPEVAHGDGVRTNNHVSNLRWATRQENCDDMPVHGTLMRGDEHVTRILSEAEVRQIRKVLAGKAPRARPFHRDIAAKYGVTRECVTQINNDRRWQHVSN